MITTCLMLAGVAALVVSSSPLGFAQKASSTAKSKKDEATLLETLKSDGSRKDKADALRVLGQVGTRECVADVAPLLKDEELSHMARYALEPIPVPAVDDALRAAVGEVKGVTLAGVIGSIGVRRDPKAVAVLTPILLDGDSQVAQATARALGSIGTLEAAKALEAALPKAAEADRPAVYEGLFRSAEALAALGQHKTAAAIYDNLAKANPPTHVKDVAVKAAAALCKCESKCKS